MRTSLHTVLLLAGTLGACASGPRPTAAYAGDVRCAPAMEALPSIDVPESELSAQMKRARLLTAESVALRVPIALDTGAASLVRWSDSELKTWLAEKHRRANAARQELDRAAVVNHRERIMAGALVGLVNEDMARALLSLPSPRELEAEPEVRKVFGEVLQAQAAPYLVHAQLAYRACAANAHGLASMDHWSGFCAGRGGELPGADQADGTTVTVVAAH